MRGKIYWDILTDDLCSGMVFDERTFGKHKLHATAK